MRRFRSSRLSFFGEVLLDFFDHSSLVTLVFQPVDDLSKNLKTNQKRQPSNEEKRDHGVLIKNLSNESFEYQHI